MVNSEQMAEWIGNNSPKRDEVYGRKDSLVPPLPKPGEVIICQQCGKPMYPKDFSKDPKIRKREFKWHLHHACEQRLLDLCDINTRGLLAERQGNISSAAINYAMSIADTKEKPQYSMPNQGGIK